MTTNRPDFTAHDDFILGIKKTAKVTREEFIKYIRNSHEQMRELIQIIHQYDQTIEDYLEEWDSRLELFELFESAESERVANEEERISKDSDRDSKIDSKANKQQEEWIRPTILNGWIDHMSSSVFPPTGFMKDEFGFVHIRGHMNGGEDMEMFILPEGYRPPHDMFFIVVNNHTVVTGFNGLIISRNGTVRLQSMNGLLRPSLNVSFRAVES